MNRGGIIALSVQEKASTDTDLGDLASLDEELTNDVSAEDKKKLKTTTADC
jgi:hypothetical protein